MKDLKKGVVFLNRFQKDISSNLSTAHKDFERIYFFYIHRGRDFLRSRWEISLEFNCFSPCKINKVNLNQNTSQGLLHLLASVLGLIHKNHENMF